MLRIIERVTRSRIEPMNLPTCQRCERASRAQVQGARARRGSEPAKARCSRICSSRSSASRTFRRWRLPLRWRATPSRAIRHFLLGGRGGREDESPGGAWPRSAANEAEVSRASPGYSGGVAPVIGPRRARRAKPSPRSAPGLLSQSYRRRRPVERADAPRFRVSRAR